MDVRELLHSRGLRCTRQREVLLDALLHTRSHPTAEQLLKMVHDRGETEISLATVYNTLEAFTGRALCRKIPTAGPAGAARYDADVSDHVHLIGPDGTVADLPSDLSRRVLQGLSPDLLREIEQRLGLAPGGLSVHFIAAPAPNADPDAHA